METNIDDKNTKYAQIESVTQDVTHAPSSHMYLFICGPAAGHKHYVEPSQTSNWYKKQTSHTHHSHTGRRRQGECNVE